MQEQVNEKISLLIDDELQSDKALSLLRTLGQDDALKQRLQRYQLISQVLKNDSCYVLDKHFADKIHQQISYEPTFMLPRKKSSLISFNWQKAGLALAASITLAVVWVAYKVDTQKNPYTLQPAMAINMQQPNTLVPLNPHFNDYLQAHDNAVYSSDVYRTQPYARVVGYQEQ
ncbi:sigma-E factor negative regulatory protein [Methylomonas sp. AM2-LC]|uniref:sigma-E factor negative regulatory protein n=1 Tax=Methylomonas sp. AM2-LC TaxID=3153301 RepID=UPI0032674F9B